MPLSSGLKGNGRLEEFITLSPCSNEGNAEMKTLWGIADPERLAALGKLLEDYAKEMGISGDQEARERLAEQILALFNDGVPMPEIRRRLDSRTASPSQLR